VQYLCNKTVNDSLQPPAITQSGANSRSFRDDVMNSKTAMFVSILLMMTSITIWSVSVLSAEPVAIETPTLRTTDAVSSSTSSLARQAIEEAASEAALSIQSSNRLDLDIRLIGATELQLAAK
jgi:hypothetical protein